MRVKQSEYNRLQLLFRIDETYYILSFWNYVEAKQFSDALLDYVKILYMKYVPADVRARFESILTAVDWLVR